MWETNKTGLTHSLALVTSDLNKFRAFFSMADQPEMRGSSTSGSCHPFYRAKLKKMSKRKVSFFVFTDQINLEVRSVICSR